MLQLIPVGQDHQMLLLMGWAKAALSNHSCASLGTLTQTSWQCANTLMAQTGYWALAPSVGFSSLMDWVAPLDGSKGRMRVWALIWMNGRAGCPWVAIEQEGGKDFASIIYE